MRYIINGLRTHRHVPSEHERNDGLPTGVISREIPARVGVLAPLQMSSARARQQHDDVGGEEEKGGKRERRHRKPEPRDDLEEIVRTRDEVEEGGHRHDAVYGRGPGAVGGVSLEVDVRQTVPDLSHGEHQHGGDQDPQRRRRVAEEEVQRPADPETGNDVEERRHDGDK